MMMNHAPMNRQNFYAGLLVVLLLAVSASTFIVVKKVESSPAVHNCEVQNRGLRAQPHLIQLVYDIEILLTPYPGEKAAPTPPKIQGLVGNLREEAGAYVTIAREQPPPKPC